MDTRSKEVKSPEKAAIREPAECRVTFRYRDGSNGG
jgi:hypothetical protein